MSVETTAYQDMSPQPGRLRALRPVVSPGLGLAFCRRNAMGKQNYNRWTIVREAVPRLDASGWKLRRVLCRCKCGTLRVVDRSPVVTGHSKSCGCLQREKASRHGRSLATHGYTGSRTYESWSRMKQRCNNPNDPSYAGYGGDGVTICLEWTDSFETFLRDMGDRPGGCSLDRYPDLAGDYKPGNCRWATPQQQARNRRTNRMLTFQGRSMCTQEWAVATGIKSTTIRQRLNRGWSVEEALTLPAGSKRSR